MIHLTVINTSRVNWLTAPPADVAQAACATYQGVFSPADISSYWANPAGTGSFVKVKFAQILLFHPVQWKDEEIEVAAQMVASHKVLPCPVNAKGMRLVDAQTLEGSVVVEVAESVVQISEKLETSRAMAHLATAAQAESTVGDGAPDTHTSSLSIALEKVIAAHLEKILGRAAAEG